MFSKCTVCLMKTKFYDFLSYIHLLLMKCILKYSKMPTCIFFFIRIGIIMIFAQQKSCTLLSKMCNNSIRLVLKFVKKTLNKIHRGTKYDYKLYKAHDFFHYHLVERHHSQYFILSIMLSQVVNTTSLYTSIQPCRKM